MDDTTTTLAGRYELRRQLGQGGMADVVLAYDDQLHREVAVKILHARYASDPEFLARFRREAQAVAGLSHHNIVSVYDAGEHSGRPFIVMEHVRGRALSDVLATEAVTPERAVEIIGDAARGLHYAHDHSLIHRDVKPGNILVASDGQVKVTDFGIARAVNAENATQTASVFGTAAYVAPEQARGEEVDRRTDVYALGCVLYELLAGRPPFSADSAVALAYKHVAEVPPRPSEHNPEVSDDLDAIVMKAMAKDPDDRYATARELHADLQRVQAGMAVFAPVGGAYATTQALSDPTSRIGPVAAAPGVLADEDEAAQDTGRRPRRSPWLAILIVLGLALLALAGVLLADILAGQTAELPVPEVTGFDVEVAQEVLRDEGFVPVVATEREQTAEFAENEVVRTDPPAGELATEGSEVALFVNDGPPLLEVPPLSGMREQDAQQELVSLGLGIGIRSSEASDEFARGEVISTDPPAGEEVQEGTEVSLLVSSGPESVTLPGVEGAEEGAARGELEGLCEPRPCLDVEITSTTSDTVEAGLVVDQDPGPGAEVDIGSTVTLTVSEGTDSVTLPNVENQEEDDAISRLEQACEPTPCVQVRVERGFDEQVADGRVVSQDPEPSSQVERGSTVSLLVSDGPEPDPDEEDEAPDADPDEDQAPEQGAPEEGQEPDGQQDDDDDEEEEESQEGDAAQTQDDAAQTQDDAAQTQDEQPADGRSGGGESGGGESETDA